MESKPTFPESTAPSAMRGRSSKRRIVGIISAVLLSVLVVTIIVTSLSGNEVVWLTPAQLAARTQPGPFAAFKQKVRNLAAPVLKRFRRSQPLITLDCKVLTFSSTTLDQAGLGEAVTSSSDGMRAWILAPTETSTFQQFMKTNTGANLLGSSAIQTMHGGQARIVASGSPSSGATTAAITVDVLPRNSAGAIRLTLSATATTKVGSLTNAPLIRTNLAVACQALVPSGGCLVIDGGTARDDSTNRYWMIISPRHWVVTPGKPATK